jgi:hypothetical protein
VDVDDLCFGDPRYPAALTMAVLMAQGGPVAYVKAWLRHAAQTDDPVFWLYVSAFLLDLMSEHGHRFNGMNTPPRLGRGGRCALRLRPASPEYDHSRPSGVARSRRPCGGKHGRGQ